MLRVAPTAAFVLTLAGAPAMADTVLLPDVSVHLLAAHYAPVDTDFRWVGWIGAGAGLVEVGGVTAYFTADVETIIGNTRRTFDANQANYHLDAALVAGQKAEAYVAGDARFVTVERSDAFPRGNFLDRSAEGGVRWRRGGRSLETFAAWQRRNDVFVQRPGAWSRALFGFRI